jgi:hypothetical protein
MVADFRDTTMWLCRNAEAFDEGLHKQHNRCLQLFVGSSVPQRLNNTKLYLRLIWQDRIWQEFNTSGYQTTPFEIYSPLPEGVAEAWSECPGHAEEIFGGKMLKYLKGRNNHGAGLEDVISASQAARNDLRDVANMTKAAHLGRGRLERVPRATSLEIRSAAPRPLPNTISITSRSSKINAVMNLLRSNPDDKFVIFGSGPQLEAVAEALDIAEPGD